MTSVIRLSQIILIGSLALSTMGCRVDTPSLGDGPVWVATIPPIGDILRELAGDRGTVHVLLPPGVSPHTYAPRPSDMRLIDQAAGVFYTSMDLDGWVTRTVPEKATAIMDDVPDDKRIPMDAHEDGHGHDEIWNSHVWLDPQIVEIVAPLLAKRMGEEDPEGESGYQARAEQFVTKSKALDTSLAARLAPLRGEAVLLMHPSMTYFLHRYGIDVAGYVELSPGQKPSPKDLDRLIRTAREQHVKAVFSEVQLPRQMVAAVGEALGLPVYELDPLGGVEGRNTYEGLLNFNADILLKALS